MLDANSPFAPATTPDGRLTTRQDYLEREAKHPGTFARMSVRQFHKRIQAQLAALKVFEQEITEQSGLRLDKITSAIEHLEQAATALDKAIRK